MLFLLEVTRVRFPPPPPFHNLLTNHSRPPQTINNQPVTTSFGLIIFILNCPSLSLNVYFSALKLHANCTQIRQTLLRSIPNHP